LENKQGGVLDKKKGRWIMSRNIICICKKYWLGTKAAEF
jgi:hypothetical protein